ncbi:F-box protein SNE [Elaeis guineensis]|uniref:F-box protein SNE n=1 Tax=Elaeis guineensis var. tenera TaxID=51953 RepID=A0A6I9QAM2_ELAGV|nr:F-box protein SNE [Elaeis guineensis]
MGDMILPLEEEEDMKRRNTFSINDNVDLLVEILGRLDGRSLGVAACVCRLWSSVCRRDSVWEALCNRHVAGGGGGPGTRSVVAALGGYRRLYRLCVGPVLDRLAGGPGRAGWAPTREEAAHLSLSLSLSLFSIDCYERLGGPRQRPASLLFLCKPVNVS